MKKVVKVSIGNLAFTIEEDGYELLKSYLGELRAHYRVNPNGNEIIEGIEERIAELFLEKSGKEGVVSTQVVKEVVNILGRPEAIDGEEGYSQYTDSGENVHGSAPKRFYRDSSNKILGGVCSGLGAYTKIDTTLVRIIFVIMFFGFSAVGFHFGMGSFMILAYIVLWIFIPEARTVEQRCAMHGEKPDLSHIQRRVEDGFNRVGGQVKKAGLNGSEVVNTIFRVFVKIFAAILILIALSGLVTLSFLLLGVEIFQGFIPIDVFDYLYLGVSEPFWLKLSLLMVLLLPLLGMLYGGIQALFGFKSPKIRPGLIIFILWIISVFSFIGFAARASRPYWNNSVNEINLPVRSDIDTLYIKLRSPYPMPETKVFMEADISDFLLCWFDSKEHRKDIVVFPELNIVRQSDHESPEVRCRLNTMGYSLADAKIKGQKLEGFMEIQDSLLIINADVYNGANKWDGTLKEVSIYIPDRIKTIVQEPVKHDFTRSYTKGRCWRKYHRYNPAWEWND
jgi:phage shock protein PspC (stress-responsive transcriptional regulator)